MKNARLSLRSNFVGGRAHQGPVILVVSGCVGQLGGCAVLHGVGSPSGHMYEVGRVVEGPMELNLGRICHHLAHHIHHFALPNSMDHWSFIPAHRNVLDVQKESLAGALSNLIDGLAGVGPCLLPAYVLKHQTPIGDKHTICWLKLLALKKKTDRKKYIYT